MTDSENRKNLEILNIFKSLRPTVTFWIHRQKCRSETPLIPFVVLQYKAHGATAIGGFGLLGHAMTLARCQVPYSSWRSISTGTYIQRPYF